MKKSKAPKTMVNAELSQAVGKFTLLKLEWKDWTKEQPKSGAPIYVILKTKDGYEPFTADYIEETIPASKDGQVPESRWRTIKFHDFTLGDCFIDNKKHAKSLVAWAYPQKFGPVLRDKLPE